MNPFATTTELLEHQKEAVAKLLPVKAGALFAEMGTGKSRIAIELARLRHKKIDRVLWFCPVSLRETVKYEILKHTDCKDVYVFNQKTDEQNVDTSARWYVIGLESISQSTRAAFATYELISENTFAIVDESTYIKNNLAMRTKRLVMFCEDCRYRMILTGTPLTQGVEDLFSQMYFLSPKILGYKSWYSFASNHLEYHPTKKGMIVQTHNTEFLAAKVQPYVYQILKEECLSLPDKLYQTHYVELSKEQEAAYEYAKQDFKIHAVDGADADEINSIAIFHLFTSLQSIVCGFWNYNKNWHSRGRLKPELVKKEYKHNRVLALLDVIGRIPPDEKVIIWAKFRYCIRQICEALAEQYGAENVVEFHGGQSPAQREVELARFKADSRFFVATQSCGGHGLTLNEACYVIFYADGFKYSERVQAEDRCHRIGQTRPVTYISIRSNSKIDDKIATALENKSDTLSDFRSEVDKIKSEGINEWLKNSI